MSEVNLFEKATREAWRFPSPKGQLDIEQVWKLPLQDRSGFDLDAVAKLVNADVKTQQEESFVTPVKVDDTARQKLNLIRYVINVKLAERDEAVNAKARAEEKQKLMAILETKQAASLEALSEEEIRQRLAKLG
ncbi:MAG TPA: hypothetical protein VFM18_07370 [Methanosarcina sp.]|nr:hypothetical protein [Methanosarcina sp.]